MLNNTGSSIPAGTPVSVDVNGNIQLVDISIAANAKAFIGLTLETIANGQKGYIAVGGVLKNIGAITYASTLFVSKTGGITTTEPEIGAGSPAFANQDWALEIGTVIADPDIVGQRNLILRPAVRGRL